MTRAAVTAIVLLALSACGGTETAQEDGARAEPADAAVASVPAEQLPPVMVYKTEGCGCCNGWVEHLQAAGFAVDARNVTDLMSVKVDAGVPADLSSCHTAVVDGYVVEGHVPAAVVARLLTERPEVAGIAVPGMPVGSPGMEGPNPQPYEVLAFDRDGGRTVFAEVDPR